MLCDLHPGVVFSPLFGSILMVSFVTVAVCCCCCCCCCCFEDRRRLFLSQLFLYLPFYLCTNCCVYGSCYFAFFYLHVHQVTKCSKYKPEARNRSSQKPKAKSQKPKARSQKPKKYFASCDSHHDIYTCCYWQIFWHSI